MKKIKIAWAALRGDQGVLGSSRPRSPLCHPGPHAEMEIPLIFEILLLALYAAVTGPVRGAHPVDGVAERNGCATPAIPGLVASPGGFPWSRPTSASRSFMMICSAVNRFRTILVSFLNPNP